MKVEKLLNEKATEQNKLTAITQKTYYPIQIAQEVTQLSRKDLLNAIAAGHIKAKKEHGEIFIQRGSIEKYFCKVLSMNPPKEFSELKLYDGEKIRFLEEMDYELRGCYFVTNMGRCGNTRTKTILNTFDTGRGYQQVKLFDGEKQLQIYIQDLVAEAFCPHNRKYFYNGTWQVHHILIGKEYLSHNYADNLLYVTIEEHHLLHRLWRQGKEKEYYALVDEIERLNALPVAELKQLEKVVMA